MAPSWWKTVAGTVKPDRIAFKISERTSTFWHEIVCLMFWSKLLENPKTSISVEIDGEMESLPGCLPEQVVKDFGAVGASSELAIAGA